MKLSFMDEKIGFGTVSISIRLDRDVKKDAEHLFSELGMNMTTAINVFLRHCIMENRIPFEIGLRRPSIKATERAEGSEAIMSGEMTFEELVRTVAPVASKHGVTRMSLFGSRARGDNRKDSDFDFCIDAPQDLGYMKMGGLLYDLKEALKADVDLVCESDIEKTPHLKEEILRDRKIVFEA